MLNTTESIQSPKGVRYIDFDSSDLKKDPTLLEAITNNNNRQQEGGHLLHLVRSLSPAMLDPTPVKNEVSNLKKSDQCNQTWQEHFPIIGSSPRHTQLQFF